MSSDQENPSPPSVAYGSPGSSIQAARKRAGMSIEELASRTRLTRATLEAMESDAFDQLLEPVYVRGYYRKCARILDLPDEPLIEAYEALYVPPPKPAAPARLRLVSGGELGTSARLPRRLVILAPLAAIVISIVVWVLQNSAPRSGPGSSSVTLIDPLSGETVMSDAMPPVDDLPPPGGNETAGPATPAPERAAAPQAAPADAVERSPSATVTEAAPASTAPVGTKLVLKFNAISWARVEDASGKSLLSGVIAAGENRELDGRPPYSVFLGNAPGVSVVFGGQPVNATPFIKPNSTARFSVPVAGN